MKDTIAWVGFSERVSSINRYERSEVLSFFYTRVVELDKTIKVVILARALRTACFCSIRITFINSKIVLFKYKSLILTR